ncbi:acyl-CoA dehydrogenase [Lactobacillus sp. CBA3606]|uniref:acyl-CoA dehydrogenase family protein n=1 Tax=Lactobacillus sp. CBA3606 TaxID=2099789 RepID=UPI000CFD65A1|nr:acyl-CoA dehydrogenase family protein [Lactobacillus sp. CBA3606]AVK64201.1 acyl-CoA dehydrogenase [Lactobacillus sp. CBA3606]
MELNLTTEQAALWQKLTTFTAQKITPLDHEIDQQGRFAAEAYALLVQQGLPQQGLTAPFGQGLDMVSQVLCVMALAQGSASVATTLASLWQITAQIDRYGTADQRATLLAAAQTKLMGFAVTEPGGGNALGVQTTAFKSTTGWLLDGEKVLITNGGQAAHYLVLAKTDQNDFAIFMIDATMPGVKVTQPVETLGLRGVAVAGLQLNNVAVTTTHLLGQIGQGLEISRHQQNMARIFNGALAAGIMQHALTQLKPYTQQRHLVDGPLNTFATAQTQVATMATTLRATQLLTLDAARQMDRQPDFAAAATMATLFGSQNGLTVTNQALQLAGGLAYTRQLPFEQLMRDMRALTLIDGPVEMLQQELGAAELDAANEGHLMTKQPVPVTKRIEVADLPRVIKALRLTEEVPVTVGGIRTAKRIIALGRGADNPEVLLQAQQLAKWIGAAVAVTRPLTTKEQFSIDQQIGTGGATVTPEVIINIGISGSEQYVSGMMGATHILSVNQDATAAIFRVSQQAFVGTAAAFLAGVLAALK